MKSLAIVATILVLACVTPAHSDSHTDGFTALFDGQTLTGWIGEGREYFDIENRVLTCRPGCQGKLLTQSEYRDFALRFDFRLTPGANNGLAIRASQEGDAAYQGIELQILDSPASKYKTLQPHQYHGSAYGIAPAKRGALKPVGEWNTQEVVCMGREIKVTLNGQVILEVDLGEVAPDNKTIDGKAHPGLSRERGHIGFLCHGDVVSFRKIRIKELAAASPTTLAK